MYPVFFTHEVYYIIGQRNKRHFYLEWILNTREYKLFHSQLKSLKLLFYLITSRRNRYYTIGSFMLIISAILSLFFNSQSFNCLTKLSEYYNSPLEIDPQNKTTVDLQRNCFIITNSYVFSGFGIIIGVIILIVGYWKKKKNK